MARELSNVSVFGNQQELANYSEQDRNAILAFLSGTVFAGILSDILTTAFINNPVLVKGFTDQGMDALLYEIQSALATELSKLKLVAGNIVYN